MCKKIIIWKQAQNWEDNDDIGENDKQKHKPTTNVGKRMLYKKWNKPSLGISKLNFDGSCSKEGDMKGGSIIRNHEGIVQGLTTGTFGKRTPIKAETLSLREGVCEAIRIGIKKIHIE